MSEALTQEVRDRRVAVARDLKVCLTANKVTIRRGKYLALSCGIDRELHELRDASCQPIIDKVEAACPVCLRGALLLSKIRLFNDVTGQNLLYAEFAFGNEDLLEDTFDRKTLGLLEAAFEDQVDLGVWMGASRNDSTIMANFGRHLGPEAVPLYLANHLIEQEGVVNVDLIAQYLEQEGATPLLDHQANP